MPAEICLLVGCARSGTSILGELLNSHDDIAYFFEQHQLWEYGQDLETSQGHRRTADEVDEKIRQVIRFNVLNAVVEQGKPVLVEKNPRNTLRVGFLAKILPEAKFIHIVRDGRDVTCSLKPGLKDEWNHLKPPRWQEYQQRGLTERCARTWLDSVSIALEELQGTEHVNLRYEDLLRDPENIAVQLADFLNLTPSEDLLSFARNSIQDRTEGSYHAENQDQWFRQNHKKRVGRWRENLSEEEISLVEAIQGDLLRKLGYME